MRFFPERVRRLSLKGLISLVLFASVTASSQPQVRSGNSQPEPSSRTQVRPAGVPLAFEPNQGQLNSAVKYAARSGTTALLLTDSEAVFLLPKSFKCPANIKSVPAQTAARQTVGPNIWSAVRMQFVGGHDSSQYVPS